MAERERTVPQSAVAALFGVDVRTIRNWVDAGMPHRIASGRPAYLLSEVIPWRREQDKREARVSAAPDLAEEQARKMRADADLSELKRDQMRGDLVPAVDVERRMERLCAYVRVRVMGIRGKWAPKVMGLGTMQEATATLDALSWDILEALRENADELDDPDTEEVAA
jgi:phage terminase Nu1 subunit (DNA packaging protein)